MFVSDRIVFLELQKTGCTHIRELLRELVGGEFVGKHNQAGRALFVPGRAFLGSVRDPWEWYVSLWAYGCDGKGVAYGNLTKPGLRIKGRGWRTAPVAALRGLLRSRTNTSAAKFQRTYRDVGDAGGFREWLHMLHDSDCVADLGEDYGGSPLNRFAGLMTYRYVRLFTLRKDEALAPGVATTHEQLAGHDRQRCFIDHFIRNEHLESDLLAALDRLGFAVPEATRDGLLRRPRTNTSSRRHATADYYDDASRDLVGDRDRLVVGKFGYRPPG
ncbi:MAG TPA: hypothetical protein VM619_07925 [Luteimonas sp.]|nr:hypothetical protein [Luteimonas sp.]